MAFKVNRNEPEAASELGPTSIDFMLILTIVCILGFSTLIMQGWQRNASLKRIEVRLDRMAAASGIGTGLEPSETVRELAQMGDLSGAAGKYRAETGVDTEYAKSVVRQFARKPSG